MTSEQNIKHQNGGHWVLRVGPGHFEVRRDVGGVSERRATIHFRKQPDEALQRAIVECDRRAAVE